MKDFNIDTQALLQRFLDYVQIDSESDEELAMCRRVEKDLKEIGLEVTTDDILEMTNSTGYNVYGTLPGNPELEPIIFCSHLDTVVPGLGVKPQVCDDGYVRTDGTTILGADDKAGVCAIFEAVKAAKTLKNRPTVEVIFTVQEEVGMFGAKHLNYDKILSKQAVILDSCDPPNKIITAAPGQNKIKVKIIGKRSHAGVNPEGGVSAIAVGADAISKMNLFRIDEETTCNIGTFKAIGPTNIIAPKANLEFEVRSRSKEKLEAQTKHIVDTLEKSCKEFEVTMECQVFTTYYAFRLGDEEAVVQRVMDGIKAFGLTPETVDTGGGSDANVFNNKGISAVNIGIGSQFVHTTKEQQNIEHLNQVSQICYEIIAKYENAK